ncbi:MAG: tail fiber protein [Magnetococcales bacterium]|nr:tail fiber protein [Magnetococcales bacterium]
MDAYLGEIKLWPSTRIPNNWHLCDGTAMPVNGNEALFAVIGTIWGGDGKVNFKLPDLRGRCLVGQGAGVSGTPPQTTPLTPRITGQYDGAATVQLTTANLPGHSHAFTALTSVATSTTPQVASMLASGDPNPPPGDKFYCKTPPSKVLAFQLAGSAVESNTPADSPHNNLMVSFGLNFIICTQGLFPSQNP